MSHFDEFLCDSSAKQVHPQWTYSEDEGKESCVNAPASPIAGRNRHPTRHSNDRIERIHPLRARDLTGTMTGRVVLAATVWQCAAPPQHSAMIRCHDYASFLRLNMRSGVRCFLKATSGLGLLLSLHGCPVGFLFMMMEITVSFLPFPLFNNHFSLYFTSHA